MPEAPSSQPVIPRRQSPANHPMAQVSQPIHQLQTVPSPPVRTILAVQGGSNSSCAVLTTLDGTLLHTVYGPALNPSLISYEVSASALVSLVRQTLRADLASPFTIVIAISGVLSQSLRQRYQNHIQRVLGPGNEASIFVSNEVLAPLGLVLSAIRGHDIERSAPRIVVAVANADGIAMTCSVRDVKTYRSSGNHLLLGTHYMFNMEKKCGGWGSVFAKDGCQYAVALEVLNLAFRITDGRIPIVIKKGTTPGSVAIYRDDEIKGLAVTIMYAAMAHFSVRADDFEDAVLELSSLINSKMTNRAKIASFATMLSSLAASGHGLCKQVFTEAGHEIGAMVLNVIHRDQGIVEGAENKTPVCIIGEMFNCWAEVSDFSDAFRSAVRPFLDKGGQIFTLKSAIANPILTKQSGLELAYGCAHAAAVACAVSNEEWANKSFGYLQRI